MTIHRASATDCIQSIAAEYGHASSTIWEHPRNEALRQQRDAPESLLRDDEVFIPELTLKRVGLATHRVHRFRRKGIPHRVKLTLLDEDGEPRVELAYELEIGRVLHVGRTDGDGKLDVPVYPKTTQATLRLFELDAKTGKPILVEQRRLVIGGLDPTRSITGIQGRLRNLGFYHGPVDGELGPHTREALAFFQEREGLDVSGEADDATRAALFKAHQR